MRLWVCDQLAMRADLAAAGARQRFHPGTAAKGCVCMLGQPASSKVAVGGVDGHQHLEQGSSCCCVGHAGQGGVGIQRTWLQTHQTSWQAMSTHCVCLLLLRCICVDRLALASAPCTRCPRGVVGLSRVPCEGETLRQLPDMQGGYRQFRRGWLVCAVVCAASMSLSNACRVIVESCDCGCARRGDRTTDDCMHA